MVIGGMWRMIFEKYGSSGEEEKSEHSWEKCPVGEEAA